MRMEGRRDAGRDSDAIGRAFFPFALHLDLWAMPPLSRMRFATPNGVSLTGVPPPIRCSAQESEGEESKAGEQISLDSDRPSHGRVRFAAPNCGAPLTAPRRSGQTMIATGGSGGNTRRPAEKTKAGPDQNTVQPGGLDRVAPYQNSR